MSTIKIGVRSVMLKAYRLTDFGLAIPTGFKDVAEYRQKYFHLHFLPVFPTGKAWFLIDDKGVQHESSPELNRTLTAKLKKSFKTPWYTLLVPILGVIAVLVTIALGVYQFSGQRSSEKDEFTINAADLNAKVSNPTTEDFLQLKKTGGTMVTGTYLKIEEVKADSIVATKLVTDLRYKDRFVPYLVRDKYDLQGKGAPKLSLALNDIRAAFPPTYFLIPPAPNEKYGVDLFNDGDLYVVEKIMRIHPGPIIHSTGSGSQNGGEVVLGMVNAGGSGKIVEIEERISKISKRRKPPSFLKKGARFDLLIDYENEERTYDVVIIVADENGGKYKYRVSGTMLDERVELIE